MIFPFNLDSLMIPDQCRGVCAFDRTSGSGQLRTLATHCCPVRFQGDTVAKLRPRKNRATLIRRHTLLGKNESLHP